MPLVEEKPNEKQGLLAFGFRAGEKLPFLSEEIPHRVGKKGDLEWTLIPDPVEYFLNAWTDLERYLQSKEKRLFDWISRGWRLLAMALDGLPVELDYSDTAGVRSNGLLRELYPIRIASYWEGAEALPHNIQAAILHSAYEYIKNQSQG